jgi:hypothetical protein
MLTREQLHAFLCMRKHRRTIWSAHDKQLIHYMGEISMANFSPDSEISRLLHYIAYGNLKLAQAMLEENPRLVLQRSHIETPSGLKVLQTTPLECALGAGDPEMAKMIDPYFEAKGIVGGAAVREEQYTRYRPYIENIMEQEPYDFTLLLDTLIQASPQDVEAALNNEMTHQSALSDVLTQFRNEFTPNKITVGMHFNYLHLLRAFEVFEQKFDHLHNGNNYDKNRIFCRQVIGFIQRSLPAIDRMGFAQALYNVVLKNSTIKRSYQLVANIHQFPATTSDYSLRDRLGFDYFIGHGGREWGGPWCRDRGRWLGDLCRAKTADLQNLCGRSEKKRRLDA